MDSKNDFNSCYKISKTITLKNFTRSTNKLINNLQIKTPSQESQVTLPLK